MGSLSTWIGAVDRTAALALGVAAGFAIGLSFNAAGREQVAAWFGLGSAVAPVTVSPAAAPPEERPELAPPGSSVISRVAATGKLRIGVFGDSFGNGIWAALYRQLPADQGYDVLRFSKEATGFTRYHSLDLEQRAREQIARQPIDVAVICFGANDVQPFFAEGHLQPLMSDGWKRIVGERIDRFVASVRSTGAPVFWLGLPVVRDPTLDQDLQAMNRFYAERMRALHVPFIDTRMASLGPGGGYDAHLINPETHIRELMRTSDGVHMSIGGYELLTAPVVDRVRDYAALVKQASAKPGAAQGSTR